MSLVKISKIEANFRDSMGGSYKMSDIPFQDRKRIEDIIKMRGAGYRGDIKVKIGGMERKLRLAVNDSDRMVKKNISSANKAKNMLYKETDIHKKASAYGSIMNTGKKVIKTTSKKPNHAEKIMGNGPASMDKIKTYGKIGAGALAIGGLAALKS